MTQIYKAKTKDGDHLYLSRIYASLFQLLPTDGELVIEIEGNQEIINLVHFIKGQNFELAGFLPGTSGTNDLRINRANDYDFSVNGLPLSRAFALKVVIYVPKGLQVHFQEGCLGPITGNGLVDNSLYFELTQSGDFSADRLFNCGLHRSSMSLVQIGLAVNFTLGNFSPYGRVEIGYAKGNLNLVSTSEGEIDIDEMVGDILTVTSRGSAYIHIFAGNVQRLSLEGSGFTKARFDFGGTSAKARIYRFPGEVRLGKTQVLDTDHSPSRIFQVYS